MKWIGTKNLGLLLLAIWLIATGVLTFVHIASVNTAPDLGRPCDRRWRMHPVGRLSNPEWG